MFAASLKTREFQVAARNCTEIFSRYFVLRINKEKNKDNFTYGIVISKKIANACKRNKIKRRLRTIIEKHAQNTSSPQTIIIYARKAILNATYSQLETFFQKEINKSLNNERY